MEVKAGRVMANREVFDAINERIAKKFCFKMHQRHQQNALLR